MSNTTPAAYTASNLGEPEAWPITNKEQAEMYITAVAARTQEQRFAGEKAARAELLEIPEDERTAGVVAMIDEYTATIGDAQ